MPLSRDEERELLTRAKAGDRDAADTLVRSAVPFLHRAARSACKRCPGLDYAEAFGAALEAVARCLMRFDPSKGFRFLTYAGTAAKRAIYKEVQLETLRHSRLPHDPDHTDPDLLTENPLRLPDSAGDAPDRVRSLLATLDAVSAEAVSALFGIGRPAEPFRRVRLRLGYSADRLSRLVARALDRMAGADRPHP